MAARVRVITDPACSWSWASEPVLRRLMVEFGDELSFTWVMGGLAREYERPSRAEGSPHADLIVHWLDVAERGRMPLDPRLWSEGPIASTYPACMAVKAAQEQATDGGYAYLRALREGLMCFRRKLDTTEALVEEARRAGLDVERFRVDLGSHAIVEAFGRDLEEARSVPDQAQAEGQSKPSGSIERMTFPSAIFAGTGGARHGVFGYSPYEDYRAAAEAAGARAGGAPQPGVVEALRRYGRLATAEVEAICDLATPPAAAELWRLAAEWKVKPVRVLTGYLWELA